MKKIKIYTTLLFAVGCSSSTKNKDEVVSNPPITPLQFTDTSEFCKRFAEDEDDGYKECMFYTKLPSQSGQGWIDTCPFGEFLINDQCEKLSINLKTGTNSVSLTSGKTGFNIIPDDYKNKYFYKSLNDGIAYLWDTKEPFSFYQEDQIYVNLIRKQVGFFIRNDGTYVNFMWPFEAINLMQHEDNPLYAITARVDVDGHIFDHTDYNRISFEKWCSLFSETHSIHKTEAGGVWDRFGDEGMKYTCTDHNSQGDTWRFSIVCDGENDTLCDFRYFAL